MGYCVTSFVDPLKGLFYAGRPLTEVYDWEPERVFSSFIIGKEGSKEEIERPSEELRKRATVSPEVIKYINYASARGRADETSFLCYSFLFDV